MISTSRGAVRSKRGCQSIGAGGCHPLADIRADEIGEAGKRRILQFAPELNLLPIKRFVILCHCRLNRIMFRAERLHNHFTGSDAAPRSPRNCVSN